MLTCGDCLTILPTLEAESVHCVITSPPYYGLRDYGTAKWEGGDENCKHTPQKPDGGERENRTLPLGRGGLYKDTCLKCGATRIDSQIGLEQTPEEYVSKLVQVFREVRRVLKKEGTVWLNLGDSYYNYRPGGSSLTKQTVAHNNGAVVNDCPRRENKLNGLKEKDLIGIPWRVAFALQADGWWLRQDIIWHKPNPMPESVTDRCTKAHEYVFLLAKSQKYYYDYKAIMEPASYGEQHANKATSWGTNRKHPNKNNVADYAYKGENHTCHIDNGEYFRNRRSVWLIATQPYSEVHFATFPPALIEPMMKAGCPKGGTVLDPFAGACTVGVVAIGQEKNFIGIELNPDYIEMGRKRIAAHGYPLFEGLEAC